METITIVGKSWKPFITVSKSCMHFCWFFFLASPYELSMYVPNYSCWFFIYMSSFLPAILCPNLRFVGSLSCIVLAVSNHLRIFLEVFCPSFLFPGWFIPTRCCFFLIPFFPSTSSCNLSVDQISYLVPSSILLVLSTLMFLFKAPSNCSKP